MKVRIVRGLLVSVMAGLAMTLFSWLFRPPLSRMGVDVVMRGVPLPWMMQVIPMAGHIIWSGFVTDLAFWVGVVFGLLLVMLHFRTGRVTHHEISKTQQS